MMFSLSDYRECALSFRGRLIAQILCPLIALGFLLGCPAAFAQTTSKEPKAKATSQTKSGTSSKSWNEKLGRIQIAKWSENKFEILDSVNVTNGEQAEIHRLVFGENADWLYRVTRRRQRQTAEFRGAKIPVFERSGAGNSLALASSPTTADVSSLKPEDLRGFYNNPPEVQQLLTAALELTEQNLSYLYGSADPTRGGMDCSGTIYFLLQKMGVSDVPRSASQQYVWVRRADVFHPVVSTRMDSFELDALRPGHLLFWTGTYSVDVDPPVTHTMIYLGKARSDGRPLMVGASDGRTFRGDKKFGVSVFDFVIPKPEGRNPMSRFIGYAEIPR